MLQKLIAMLLFYFFYFLLSANKMSASIKSKCLLIHTCMRFFNYQFNFQDNVGSECTSQMDREKSSSSVISIKLISISAEMTSTEISAALSGIFPLNDALLAQQQVVILSRLWFLNIKKKPEQSIVLNELLGRKMRKSSIKTGMDDFFFLLFRQADLREAYTCITSSLIKPSICQQHLPYHGRAGYQLFDQVSAF